MKRLLLAGVSLAASAAFAQSPADIPKASCDKPQMPGEMMRSDPSVTKRFNADLDKWTKCMREYIDQRQKAMKANEDAANAAIKDYNDTVKALNDAAKEK